MTLTLQGKQRETTSRGVNNQLRKEGYIPAIIYGKGITNIPLAIFYKDFQHLLRNGAGNTVFQLNVGSNSHDVMVKDYQTHTVTGKITHIDLQKVYLDQPIHKEVPIHLVGEETAKKEGVIQFQKREIEVKGLPNEIPNQIDLDISPLSAGAVVSVGDVPIPGNLEVYTPKDEVVLSIVSVSYTEEEPEEPVKEAPEGDLT